jgi:hypothetical protein
MMADKDTLIALRKRLMDASGPDMDLAIDINEALGIASYITDDGDPTETVDAALAIQARVLPDHDWVLGHTNGGLTIHCQMGTTKEMSFGETPALAVMVSIFDALLRGEGRVDH